MVETIHTRRDQEKPEPPRSPYLFIPRAPLTLSPLHGEISTLAEQLDSGNTNIDSVVPPWTFSSEERWPLSKASCIPLFCSSGWVPLKRTVSFNFNRTYSKASLPGETVSGVGHGLLHLLLGGLGGVGSELLLSLCN